jgi:hypothetical protein
MEGLKSEMKLLRDQLQNTGKWYLDVDSPEEESIQDIASVAKENADYELSRLSVSALYGRYNRWKEAEGDLALTGHYYDTFLSYVSFELGMESLSKADRPIFEESCSIDFNWLT